MANKNTKIKNSSIGDENQLGNFIKLIIIVAVLFLAFYLLTLIINKEEKKTEDKATIQYDTILVGNIASQPKESYYVLVSESTDTNNGLYKTYIDLYTKANSNARVYYADLDNPLNAKFVSEDSNLLVSNILDLKLKDTTLIEVEDGKIKNAYEGEDTVKSILKEMSEVAK